MIQALFQGLRDTALTRQEQEAEYVCVRVYTHGHARIPARCNCVHVHLCVCITGIYACMCACLKVSISVFVCGWGRVTDNEKVNKYMNKDNFREILCYPKTKAGCWDTKRGGRASSDWMVKDYMTFDI